jgi:hypothetical protein
MRKPFLVLVLALTAATAPVAARGDGGPGAGVSWGENGVESARGQVRFVAVPSGRGTLVEVVRVVGGRVLRWRTLDGLYGVPAVTLFGTGSGLSPDGRSLVLASFPAIPGQRLVTRFVVLDTRDLRVRARIALHGPFTFDAMSRNGSTLYLIEYTSAQDYTRYRVRAYDVAQRRLAPGVIVDKREPDEAMAGTPVSRATTSDGRWAYTLYARSGEPPFVHALDTTQGAAYCIDLPVRGGQQRQMRLRLRFGAPHELQVRDGLVVVARVDLARMEARRG